jgi:hypothetical protein
VTSRFSIHGTLYSTMMMQAVEALVEEDYRERGKAFD